MQCLSTKRCNGVLRQCLGREEDPHSLHTWFGLCPGEGYMWEDGEGCAPIPIPTPTPTEAPSGLEGGTSEVLVAP